MAEALPIVGTTKKEKYESLLPQLKRLVEGESDHLANLSNLLAALKYSMNFFWIGIYFVKKNSRQQLELVLGPFQGPVACTRIAFGKGVCGTSWKENKTLLVKDVTTFPGHIACSTASQSEMVIPCRKEGNVFAVLDVDSEQLAHFDEIDELYLQQVVTLIENLNYAE
jgi:L-methionine (R)-S-oxide reductase